MGVAPCCAVLPRIDLLSISRADDQVNLASAAAMMVVYYIVAVLGNWAVLLFLQYLGLGVSSVLKNVVEFSSCVGPVVGGKEAPMGRGGGDNISCAINAWCQDLFLTFSLAMAASFVNGNEYMDGGSMLLAMSCKWNLPSNNNSHQLSLCCARCAWAGSFPPYPPRCYNSGTYAQE